MIIVKNITSLTDDEIICRVEEFDRFFAEIFPVPTTGQKSYRLMPDGTVSQYSSREPDIIVDYSE